MKTRKRSQNTLPVASVTPADTISLRQEDIPAYLRASEFFRSLDWSEEDAVVSVPQHCFKPNQAVGNEDEVMHLLETMRYWGVSEAPVEVLRYLCAQDKATRERMRNRFQELKVLDILHVTGGHFMLEAVWQQNVELVQILLEAGLHFTKRCVEVAAEVGSSELIALMTVARNTVCHIGSLQLDLVSRVVHSHKKDRDMSLSDLAAASGKVELVRELMEKGSVLTEKGVNRAASNEHWAAAIELCELVPWTFTYQKAEKISSLKAFQFIAVDDSRNLSPLHYYTAPHLQYAIEKNSVQCVKHYLDRGFWWPSPHNFCKIQSLEMLELLMTILDPLDSSYYPFDRIMSVPQLLQDIAQQYLRKYPDCPPHVQQFAKYLAQH